MKNYRKILTFGIIILIFSIGTVNAYKNLSIGEIKTEKRIFGFNKSIVPKVKKYFESVLFMKCYDTNGIKTDKIKFECKNNWKETLKDGKAGCGFIKNTEKAFSGYCDLGKIKNNKVYYRMGFYIKDKQIEKSQTSVIKYKTNLDISNKFYKKSIQQKELSCESSATSDIISTIKNKKYTEDDVIKYLPMSKGGQTAYWYNKERYWGNPDVGFVGYIDQYKGRGALQWKYEGYGVNEAPISKVYSHYGIKTIIINKFNRNKFGINNSKQQLTLLLKELNKGNYVQLWGDTCTYPQYEDGTIEGGHIKQWQADKGLSGKNKCLDPYTYRSRLLKWKYKDPSTGKVITIEGLNGEHAFFLLGYKGGVDNPTHIIVWDTNTGKHIYPTKEWLRKWDKMQNRSIVASSK